MKAADAVNAVPEVLTKMHQYLTHPVAAGALTTGYVITYGIDKYFEDQEKERQHVEKMVREEREWMDERSKDGDVIVSSWMSMRITVFSLNSLTSYISTFSLRLKPSTTSLEISRRGGSFQ